MGSGFPSSGGGLAILSWGWGWPVLLVVGGWVVRAFGVLSCRVELSGWLLGWTGYGVLGVWIGVGVFL